MRSLRNSLMDILLSPQRSLMLQVKDQRIARQLGICLAPRRPSMLHFYGHAFAGWLVVPTHARGVSRVFRSSISEASVSFQTFGSGIVPQI